ncbi:FadR/GntR family transcriptional regulator [Mycolicibacterium porcinum]|uniref:FadR family transcriptional regulator n=1 Tax=Mycolicibacterium porcinum TaxID=39693 RepID=A0AAW5TBW2_9MYCO|nr:FadR/GntR family transcriptional regulator [Mycolicibacterium porcinum]MBX8687380.1 FCD domain-containing protein [Mycobacterium sp. 20091114027_K0903767]CDO29122.1 GntR family transcriptional regulator [Mycolicibacterium vulneris]MCV7392274.1 FadR family transcriptional regulator [Mycolicibacterium porcinum]ORB37342.1 GntR family transcriptional regulator [Mycolicibacterium porcinum]TVY00212.1 FadR family transcriptional regulator [Mycolicibacterium porcinum]
MKQIARASVVDAVVDQLRRRIHNGTWPIGMKIPTEVKLIEMLGVSRPSLREAVRSLVQLGLLETRQGDGTYVVAKDEVKVVLQNVIRAADSDEVTAVRQSLDLLAAAQAASRRTDDDVADLRAALEGRRAAVRDGDIEAFVDHDVAFHLGIARVSRNSLLGSLYQSFEGVLRDSIRHFNYPVVVDDPSSELHERILLAIEQSDAEAATAAARGLLEAHLHNGSGPVAG